MAELPEHMSCEACDVSIRHLQKLVATTEGIDRARALLDLGMAAFVALRLDLALASFGACLDLLSPGESVDLECEALFKESCVLAEMERYDEALESVSRAKAICEREGDLEHLSLCEWRQGVYCASAGQQTEALELISAARDRYLQLLRPAMAALAELDLEATSRQDNRARTRKSSRRRKEPRSGRIT